MVFIFDMFRKRPPPENNNEGIVIIDDYSARDLIGATSKWIELDEICDVIRRKDQISTAFAGITSVENRGELVGKVDSLLRQLESLFLSLVETRKRGLELFDSTVRGLQELLDGKVYDDRDVQQLRIAISRLEGNIPKIYRER